MLFAAGEPLAPDRPYRALVRNEQDLAALEPVRRCRAYTIVSAVPAVAEQDLRAAGETYPDSVTDRYLSLPPLPQRVVDLASQVVAGSDTPYDAAVALESHLRRFPYTLDVPVPPSGRDIVDFFLFDLQKGYCDYYATSMAVMARSVGLPARIAVGYASGDYHAEQGLFEVLAKDAHSWVEVYFPLYGWIPFEPTASRSTLERRGTIGGDPSSDISAGLDALRQRALADQLRASFWRRVLWGGLTVAALAAATVAWRWRRQRFEERLSAPHTAYLRLARWGELLGRPAAGHETVLEYSRALGDHLDSLARVVRPARVPGPEVARAAVQEITQLASLFVSVQYGPRPVAEAQEIHARLLWRRLRRKLWTFRVTRRLRRKVG
jgi:transglutaminase-like putative cysteine protease